MTSGVPKGKPQVSDLSHSDGLDGLQLNVTLVQYRSVTGGLHACSSQPFTGQFFWMTTFCFDIFIVNYSMDERIAPFF
jgi:hypothetical protein